MLVFECPSCKTKMQAAEEHAGKTTACPQCSTKVKIPGDGAITAEPAALGASSPASDAITESSRLRPSSRDDDRDDNDEVRRPRPGAGSSAATGAAVGMSVGAKALAD